MLTNNELEHRILLIESKLRGLCYDDDLRNNKELAERTQIIEQKIEDLIRRTKELEDSDHTVIEDEMSFYEFLENNGLELELIRYCKFNGRWSANIIWGEIKHNGGLLGTQGIGKSPELAIIDYINLIRGKILVLNSFSKYRREITVPKNIFFKK